MSRSESATFWVAAVAAAVASACSDLAIALDTDGWLIPSSSAAWLWVRPRSLISFLARSPVCCWVSWRLFAPLVIASFSASSRVVTPCATTHSPSLSVARFRCCGRYPQALASLDQQRAAVHHRDHHRAV